MKDIVTLLAALCLLAKSENNDVINQDLSRDHVVESDGDVLTPSDTDSKGKGGNDEDLRSSGVDDRDYTIHNVTGTSRPLTETQMETTKERNTSTLIGIRTRIPKPHYEKLQNISKMKNPNVKVHNTCKGPGCPNSVLGDGVPAYLKKIDGDEGMLDRNRVKRNLILAKLRRLRSLVDKSLSDKNKMKGNKKKEPIEPVWDKEYKTVLAKIKLSDTSTSKNLVDIPVGVLEVPAVRLEPGIEFEDEVNWNARSRKGRHTESVIKAASERYETVGEFQTRPSLGFAVQRSIRHKRMRTRRESDDDEDDEDCLNACWSQWSEWTDCSSSCGVGHKIQSRHCKENTDRRRRFVDKHNNDLMTPRRKQMEEKRKGKGCKGDDFRIDKCRNVIKEKCVNWNKKKGAGIQWGGDGPTIVKTEDEPEVTDDRIDAILKILSDSTLNERQMAKKMNETNMDTSSKWLSLTHALNFEQFYHRMTNSISYKLITDSFSSTK